MTISSHARYMNKLGYFF